MLVNDPSILRGDPILSLVGLFSSVSYGEEKQLALGVYQISHFGSSDWPPNCARGEDGFKEWGEYGVCDNYEQVLRRHADLVNDPEKTYVVTVTPIVKATQPHSGGWRWHKWGEYIGDLNPQFEYIHDEDDTIQQVFVYHVYRVVLPG